MPRLLVILGHTNTENCTLSETARYRCVAAADYIQKNTVQYILTTGAYGDNFNRSNIPHGTLIADELKRQCANQSNATILTHAPTAFTEEDIFFARRVFVDHSCDAATFVSSSFHSARVKEIAKLVFRDQRIDFVFAEDGSDITDAQRREEFRRLDHFRRQWVDVPLYLKNSPFPEDIYCNAMEQYKHSDSVSLAIVTGALVFLCYPYTKIDFQHSGIEASILLIVCGIVGASLLGLYFRFAAFAYIARCVLRGLELGWGRPGFSYNNERFLHSRWRFSRFFRTTRVLLVVTLLILISNLIIAGVLWKKYGAGAITPSTSSPPLTATSSPPNT